MSVKWVVFDAMGVVFTVGDDTGELLIPFVRERNPALSVERILKLYIEASLGNIEAFEFWQKLGFGEKYPDIQYEYLDTCLTLDGQFKETAAKLKGKYNLAMLSNDIGEWSAWLRKKHGLDKLFDDCVISSEVKCRKPSEEIFKLLLNRLGAAPQDCVFIDDSIKNVDAAGVLGIKTILFDRTINDCYENFAAKSFDEMTETIHKVL